jgi:hypothetical protein
MSDAARPQMLHKHGCYSPSENQDNPMIFRISSTFLAKIAFILTKAAKIIVNFIRESTEVPKNRARGMLFVKMP